MCVIVQDVFGIEAIIKVHWGLGGEGRGGVGGWGAGSDAGEAFTSSVAPYEERRFCFTESLETVEQKF